MAFRDPIYLNVPLLKNLSEYHGIIDVTGPTQVTRRRSGGRKMGAGVNKILTARIESDKGQETTESFSSEVRPVRLVNDLIDYLLDTEDMVDLVSSPGADLISRAAIQIEGDVVMSPATEIGTLMERFLPLLFSKLAAGEADPELTDSDAMEILKAPQSQASQVYDLDALDEERRFVIILDPQHITDSRTPDDLEGDLTVFGTIERLLAEGSTMSLSRYLLPGIPRVMRRSMRGRSLEELVDSFSQMSGQTLDAQALDVTGPGAVIKPVAIY